LLLLFCFRSFSINRAQRTGRIDLSGRDCRLFIIYSSRKYRRESYTGTDSRVRDRRRIIQTESCPDDDNRPHICRSLFISNFRCLTYTRVLCGRQRSHKQRSRPSSNPRKKKKHTHTLPRSICHSFLWDQTDLTTISRVQIFVNETTVCLAQT